MCLCLCVCSVYLCVSHTQPDPDQQWFALLGQTLGDLGLLQQDGPLHPDAGDQLWVVDEKGFSDEPSVTMQRGLVSQANRQPTTETGGSFRHITCLPFVSLSGLCSSPFVIVAGKCAMKAWDKVWPEACINSSGDVGRSAHTRGKMGAPEKELLLLRDSGGGLAPLVRGVCLVCRGAWGSGLRLLAHIPPV